MRHNVATQHTRASREWMSSAEADLRVFNLADQVDNLATAIGKCCIWPSLMASTSGILKDGPEVLISYWYWYWYWY